VADVILYYHLLRLAIEIIEENLDLPAKEIEKLNDSTELILSTGEVRQDTLKGALIHLGEDYDRYKKYNGLVDMPEYCCQSAAYKFVTMWVTSWSSRQIQA
jgi:hypothetical protein